ncbi:hypothetical protein [Sphingobacterium sp. 2149]|uniref:hypothetical protein n=1 Tax=Sphingobacterium sp. 2149 TaxID=2817763 RepID=UPI001AE72627|nr:hypothetical protein [Sphingobacterium sp. 2149]MDR6735303.1 hypothetical protein [Sphingobacterium sp. 2149]
MKKIFTLLFIIHLTAQAYAQRKQYETANINSWFEELKTASDQSFKLWNKSIYGPILLIDPATRTIYANELDGKKALKPSANLYTGILPQEVNFSNTALDWNDKRWAMIMLPLPENRDDRINLLAHESFHRIQPDLGFSLNNANNNHLDEKDGRISLRLEFEALKQALMSTHKNDMKRHLTNALFFRKYRYMLFDEAAKNENLLEINEGIAEFTGIIVSARSDESTKQYLINGINRSQNNRTFVRSFAYQTTPTYGYLLYKKDNDWNKKIDKETDLTALFIRKFAISLLPPTEQNFKNLSKAYNAAVIFEEENKRDAENKRLVKTYKNKFVESSHFEIHFEKMNYSFDPRTIIPIENLGTYYPTTRITDAWGILDVTNGALISPDWKKISITKPISIEKNLIKGDGWTLELNSNYTIEIDQQNNFYLKHVEIK